MFQCILRMVNTFVVVLAAVLSLCLIVLWIRSYSVADVFFLSPPAGWRYQIMTLDGRLLFQILFGRPPTPERLMGHSAMALNDARAFAPWMHGKLDIPMHWLVPILTILTSFYSFMLFMDRRQTRRKHQIKTLCHKCRYDLRAHKPGDRCPECGTVMPEPQTATRPPVSK
jgi:hypothetical protein